MTVTWQVLGAVIGVVGGLVGIVSGITNLRRNRSRLRLSYERLYQPKVFVRADQYNDDTDRVEARDWVLIHLRNRGDRPVRITDLDVLFYHPGTAGTMAMNMPLGELVLSEQRRTFTYAIDITGLGRGRPALAVARDDYGKEARCFLVPTLRHRVEAWFAFRRHRRADKDILRQQDAAVAELDRHRTRSAESRDDLTGDVLLLRRFYAARLRPAGRAGSVIASATASRRLQFASRGSATPRRQPPRRCGFGT